jgi:DNA-binding NarL/FixJ family response regulator
VTAIRVVVVDDQALMRAAFRQILDAHGVEVVAEAATADEAVAEVERTSPDVVLMDVRMPGRSGIEATAELATTHPQVRVLVLTTFDHDEYVDGALRAGAAGFLLKNATPEDLVAAVRSIAAGDGVLDPKVVGRVMSRFAAAPSRAPIGDDLTEREKDVLRLMCRGMTNAEIAVELGFGEATAKTHVSSVLSKLGVRDRVQAVIAAYESGFAP